MSTSPEAKQAADWKTKLVKRSDGSIWEGLAYIVNDGDWESGALNHLTAENICKMHNAATAKLREGREWDSVPVWVLDYYSRTKGPDSIKVREVP